jgi:hypothetical protein
MRLTRTSSAPLAAILAAAALATPAIAAGGADPAERPCVEPKAPPRQDLRMPDTRDFAQGRTTLNASEPPPAQCFSSPDTRDTAAGRDIASPVIRVTPAGGLDWGDAAIGAAGASGLLAISLAGATTLYRRHGDPRSPSAIN